jgi:hypothetical protein
MPLEPLPSSSTGHAALTLDSISCMDEMLEGFRGAPPGTVLARNVGMNSENGKKMSCHAPAEVSKLLDQQQHQQMRVAAGSRTAGAFHSTAGR